MSRLTKNLPPDTGDPVVNGLLKTAYKDGAEQAFKIVLDALEKEYMKPSVLPMSTEAEAILKVAKFLGKEIREQQSTLAGL